MNSDRDLGLVFFDRSERYLITELRALHYRASTKSPKDGRERITCGGCNHRWPCETARLTERYVRWAVRVYLKSVLEVISG